KFRIEDGVAFRTFGVGASVAVSPGAPQLRTAMALDELIAEIASASGVAAVPAEPGTSLSSSLEPKRGDFTLLGTPGRFFEVDEGGAIAFLIDERGDSILGFGPARQAVDDALATWTNVNGARIVLSDAGLTSDLSGACTAGAHKIRFDDPDDE